MTLDSAHIRSRADYTLEWIRRDPCNSDGFLPLSVREHFDHDIPALLAEIDHLRSALHKAEYRPCPRCGVELDAEVAAERRGDDKEGSKTGG
jgi:hypothetical protein